MPYTLAPNYSYFTTVKYSQEELGGSIHSANINLDTILSSLQASRAAFSVKYLGLLLSVWQLRKVNFQCIEDNITTKLFSCDGENIITIGRCALVKSVLTSQVIYHISPHIVPPGVLHFANKLERASLWAGSDKTTGAKC